jgi:hypothetical protein
MSPATPPGERLNSKPPSSGLEQVPTAFTSSGIAAHEET